MFQRNPDTLLEDEDGDAWWFFLITFWTGPWLENNTANLFVTQLADGVCLQ